MSCKIVRVVCSASAPRGIWRAPHCWDHGVSSYRRTSYTLADNAPLVSCISIQLAGGAARVRRGVYRGRSTAAAVLAGEQLPPADQLQDGHDDVAGAAGQATDNPVAGVRLGRAGELPAAVGAAVFHRDFYVTASKEFLWAV